MVTLKKQQAEENTSVALFFVALLFARFYNKGVTYSSTVLRADGQALVSHVPH